MNNQSMYFDPIDEVNHHYSDANYHITMTCSLKLRWQKAMHFHQPKMHASQMYEQ